MKKTIFLFLLCILLVGNVMAVTLTRTTSSTVNPSATFIVTYATSGAGTDKWFAAWADTVTGGCTPTVNNDFMGSETGGDKSTTKTFTAPSSGSCIFNGYYQFTGGSQTNFPAMTITISGTCTPSCTGKVCGDNGCGGTCPPGCTSGQTCNANGQCISGTQTCSQLGGNICTTTQTCSGTLLPASDSTKCCSVACTTPSTVEWYNVVVFTLGTFEVKVWMLLVLGGIIIALSFMK